MSIVPTNPDDLAGLSRFLNGGFRLHAGAAHFSPDVLRWKYFEPCGIDLGPRSFVARADGRIVGHVGLCPRKFLIRNGSVREVTTLHFVDWLASPDHPSSGLMLMLRGFRSAETQYAVGGSAEGQKMAQAVGYERRATLDVMSKILRPTHRLRGEGRDSWNKPLRFAKDLGRALVYRGRTPRTRVEVSRVREFGPEIDGVLDRIPTPIVLTARSRELLNYYLRHPGGSVSGWTVRDGDQLVGFALLNVTRDGLTRHGKIVECFLGNRDEGSWHAAITALTRELKDQSADVVTCYASTPWIRRALEWSGFFPYGSQCFYVRDRHRSLGQDSVYHLTQLEADHGYL